MEYLCKTLLNTYDTNFLDDLDIDLQQALQKEAECSEQNPNPTGKKREILLKLINNHYDPDKIKPSAKFIGGPETLTVHYLPDYQKKIYIFGEQHVDIMDCQKFPNFPDEDENVITPIEDYLYKLITNTDVFIDIFVEFFTYDKSGEYSRDPYSTNGRIDKLFKTFRKCLQKNTRHNEDCKLARIHYIDIRTEIGKKKIKKRSILFFEERMKTIENNYKSHKNRLDIIKEINYKNKDKNEDGYLYYLLYTQKFQKEITEDEIIRIWNEDMTIKQKDEWVKKELDRSLFTETLRKELNTWYIKAILSEIMT